jgi:hypothetical protein
MMEKLRQAFGEAFIFFAQKSINGHQGGKRMNSK